MSLLSISLGVIVEEEYIKEIGILFVIIIIYVLLPYTAVMTDIFYHGY